MCCALTLFVLLSPRLLLILTWLFDPVRVNAAFNTFILPCLGFILLPWTTLAYLLVWQPVAGVQGFGWVLVILGFVVDISTHGGGAWGNRKRFL